MHEMVSPSLPFEGYSSIALIPQQRPLHRILDLLATSSQMLGSNKKKKGRKSRKWFAKSFAHLCMITQLRFVVMGWFTLT